MARKKREPPARFLTSSGHGHFTPIYDDLIESKAFIQLKPQASKMLLYLYEQYKGAYTGDVVICPYRYLEERGFRHASIPQYMKQLEKAGFIRISHGGQGGLYKEPNKYQLINAWYDKDGQETP